MPHALVHLDLRRPLAPGSESFPLSSNGLASGNSRAEATAHALLELIERDAWARFCQLPPEAREELRLDLDGVSDGRPQELLRKFRGAGLDVVVWDLSGELGVACFLCQVVEKESDWAFQHGRAEGLGCHTDRGIALGRALCEAAQSRLCAISGARDDMTRASVARVRDTLAIRRAQRELGRASASGRDFAEVPTRHFPSFDREVSWLVEALRSWAGAEVVAIDIPAHGVPISVVRVVASGLRVPHFLPKQRPRASRAEELS